MPTTFELTFDDDSVLLLEVIKQGYHVATDRGAFMVAISLAASLAGEIDRDGCITLKSGVRLKIRDSG